jgi:protein SCO1
MKLYILCFLFIFTGCMTKSPPRKIIKSRPSIIVTKKLGGNFTLKTVLNNEILDWQLFSSNGKIRILYFGFTYCPDICPTSLTKLANVLSKYSKDDQEKIRPVFISVDYKRDDAKKVKEYVEYFSPRNVGLAGSEEQIKKITNQYGIYFKMIEQKDSAIKYTIDHTSRYILIARDGSFYNSYSQLDQIFTKDLSTLLKN